jgi:hypothetical protein
MNTQRGEDLFVFSPSSRTEQVQLSNEATYVIVDDALLDPEHMVQFAIERTSTAVAPKVRSRETAPDGDRRPTIR